MHTSIERAASVLDLSEPLEKPRQLRVGVVVASVVVMLAVGFWGLDRGSMWLDEAATYTVATRSVHQILAVLNHVDLVHGAYYLLEHIWLLPGGGEVWMRVPSVLAMAVAAGATAGLGVRLIGARTGLVAGLLFAGWPLVSHYAQDGRSYALVSAAILVGTWCLVQALFTRRPGWWWGYALSIVVAATLHEFAVLAVVAHGLTVLLARPGWRVWRWWLVSSLACAVLVAPLALLSSKQAGQVGWMTPPTWSTLQDLAEQFLSSYLWLSLFVVALVVVGVVAEVRQWRRGEGGELAAVALPLLLVPVAVLLGASLVHPLFEVRYVLFSVAGLPLLAARGIEVLATFAARTRRTTAVGWVVAGLLVVAISVAQLPALRHERTTDSRVQDFAGAAAVVRAEARPGDGILFIPLIYRVGAMAYPDAYRQVDDLALKRSAVQAANLSGTNRTPDAIRKAMLTRPRIWVVGTKNLRVRSTQPLGTVEMAVLRAYFVQHKKFPSPGVIERGLEVDLYVRKNVSCAESC